MKRRMNNEGSYGWKKIKGNKYIYYRDPSGKYTYAKSKKELDQKLLDKKEEKRAEINSTYIFSDYCYVWLRTMRSELAPTTYDSYDDAIRTRIANTSLGNKAIRSLTVNMINNFYNKMATQYSRGTIEKTNRVIIPTIKYGIKHQLIPELKLSDIKIPKESAVAVKRKEIQFVSLDDVEKIYSEATRKTGNNTYVYGNAAKVIIFIMYSGLRVSEAIGLTWGAVDLKNGEITVKASRARITLRDETGEKILNEKGQKQYIDIQKSPKTEHSYRTIPLPDRAIKVLKYFYNNSNHKFTDCVFINSNNLPYDKRSVQKCLDRILKHIGYENKGITLHSLRHGYGSILISKGIDIKVVSKLLGHKDITTTYNIYIGVFKEDEVNAVKSVFNSGQKIGNDQ